MTIEEKAKRYDEALERMKSWVRGEHPECFTEAPKAAEFIFPELKESEDENVRKEIISHLQYLAKYCSESMPDVDKWIAWLEKQGERNLIMANSPQLGEQKPFDYEDANIQQKDFAPKSAMEAAKEKKIDNANKVEPRFHEGEWITDGCLHCKISDVLDDRYIVDTKFGKRSAIPFKRENNYHLWSIQDAKEGDVLFHSDSASNGIFIFKEIIDKGFAKEVICYCDYDSEDHFCLGEHHTCCWTDAKILYPATKEQRDTLMKAITNAGYIFNFESKELRKIEKPIEWSYEDEANLNNIIWLCNNCIKGTETTWIPSQATKIKHLIETIKEEGLAQQNPAWSEEDEQITLSIEQAMNCASLLNVVPEKIDIIRTWLKSLKQRIGG